MTTDREFFTPDADDFESTILGVPVTYVGEDGEVCMLGQIEPRKAAVVAMTHGRQFAGLTRDDLGISTVEEALASVEHRYMTFSRHLEDCDCGDGPNLCEYDYAWWGTSAKADDPDAVAVTYWGG